MPVEMPEKVWDTDAAASYFREQLAFTICPPELESMMAEKAPVAVID